MAAPKGNRFWELRSEHGRDTLFESPELMWEASCKYFIWCEDNPLMAVEVSGGKKVKVPRMRAFTMEGLTSYLRCNTGYFNDFSQNCSKDFSAVVTRIKETVYNQKYTGATSGFLNANIIAYDLGLRKDKELTINNNTVDNDKLDHLAKLINDAAKTG